uniref:Uncharacterized protein n=1 Tax=Lactuca sativa TaxID=4236 RepID=A0A9R1XT10_LACSA|nr:hypothetical protein LSAT_V11C200072940 [Lactuca sativa]
MVSFQIFIYILETLKIVLMLSILKILRFFSNPNQNPVTNNLQTSQNTEKQPRGNKWDAAEDVALMLAWCFATWKKQKKTSLWAQIKQLYDAARVENSEKLNSKNEDQMRGRFKRLSENAQKWVGVY